MDIENVSKNAGKQVGRPLQDKVFQPAFSGGSIIDDLDEVLSALEGLNDELTENSRLVSTTVGCSLPTKGWGA